MGKSKKEIIIDAACRVIAEDGIDAFTLDKVAAVADVSKGGLLYHFSSKDMLVTEMNRFVAHSFREMIEDYVAEGMSYHKAYVFATERTILNKEITLITTSLLAAVSSDRSILDIWVEEYDYLAEKLAGEVYSRSLTLLVKAVCDGLWFAALFPFEFMDDNERVDVLHHLVFQLEEEEEK